MWMLRGNSVWTIQDFVVLMLYQRQSPPCTCLQGLKNRLLLQHSQLWVWPPYAKGEIAHFGEGHSLCALPQVLSLECNIDPQHQRRLTPAINPQICEDCQIVTDPSFPGKITIQRDAIASPLQTLGQGNPILFRSFDLFCVAQEDTGP